MPVVPNMAFWRSRSRPSHQLQRSNNMNGFRQFILAAAGLGCLAVTAAVTGAGSALAQGPGRRGIPVVITNGAGNTAAVDREGSLGVKDPRLTFNGAGHLRVDTGD